MLHQEYIRVGEVYRNNKTNLHRKIYGFYRDWHGTEPVETPEDANIFYHACDSLGNTEGPIVKCSSHSFQLWADELIDSDGKTPLDRAVERYVAYDNEEYGNYGLGYRRGMKDLALILGIDLDNLTKRR
ncbi:hypothetical protein ABGV42_01535 [Paenibacillus pabuli]|uniref:hypothetical protein n=1 Tax=Paenibacillus pabuli TaxID=1472 RepID=UPI00324207A6